MTGVPRTEMTGVPRTAGTSVHRWDFRSSMGLPFIDGTSKSELPASEEVRVITSRSIYSLFQPSASAK